MNGSIVVQQMSKRYRLGSSDFGYRTLRDAFSRGTPKQTTDEIWALREVSLQVGHGEAVGIIGHNGAGKSTLLKILSRISEPTSGQAVLHGRVASLLEVGTGFHPELTGRENIFLNGAILGMRRSEIRRDFDAIVAFAEIERFLDTPVKKYSSGMYVRLAFAVAAHLTPEILLVDEVLAVGDFEFQRRCLGRMNEVARSGRTVLFVSHNLASIEALCPRSILFEKGSIALDGATREVVSRYLARGRGDAIWDLRGVADREGTGTARIVSVEILSEDGTRTLDTIEFLQSFRIRIHWEASRSLPGVAAGLAFLTEKNERVLLTESTDKGITFALDAGGGSVDCVIQAPGLLPGVYPLEVWLSEVPGVEFADHLSMIAGLEIVPAPRPGLNTAALSSGMRGHVYVDTEWTRQ